MVGTSLFSAQFPVPTPMPIDTRDSYSVQIFETSATGHKLTEIQPALPSTDAVSIQIDTRTRHQSILGFGGSFTEASAYLLSNMSPAKRGKILRAYFSDEGARYSLARTHINSCDFSRGHYAYAMIPGDTSLEQFSIEKDRTDLFPIINQAQTISRDGFRLIASPWTAPPWMKDNDSWVGGKLLDTYRDTWALYYAKYVKACADNGISIWGITVINEPHGNGNNWESMLFTPKEMTDFVRDHLGPTLEREGLSNVHILGYDQNRAGLKEWVDEMFKDASSSKYFSGTAIHWYESTYEVFPAELQYAADKAPGKYLIQTEACVDAEVPRWNDDAWYWREEATDWGWDWAPAEQKYLHPKYAPVHRYARDIIGCLQNKVHGWIDWNMVLDRQGGPNWAQNWCTAPIIVDPATDEVYVTPLYYVMSHFSKYIRPGAEVVASTSQNPDIMAVAAANPDKSMSVVVFNPTTQQRTLRLELEDNVVFVPINGQALQTILFLPR
jgi:glucosylceramidase